MTFAMRFPRTWADVRRAPWLDFIEPSIGDDPIFLHVRMDWLPPGFERDNACSAVGYTLREALNVLRADLWSHMRPPVTPVAGDPGPALLAAMLECRHS